MVELPPPDEDGKNTAAKRVKKAETVFKLVNVYLFLASVVSKSAIEFFFTEKSTIDGTFRFLGNDISVASMVFLGLTLLGSII